MIRKEPKQLAHGDRDATVRVGLARVGGGLSLDYRTISYPLIGAGVAIGYTLLANHVFWKTMRHVPMSMAALYALLGAAAGELVAQVIILTTPAAPAPAPATP